MIIIKISRFYKKLVLTVFTITILISCVIRIEPGKDIDASWEKRITFTPENPMPLRGSEKLIHTKQYPVVIFMHGCTGIENHAEMQWGQYLKDLGFIVVIPDSLARRDRYPSCDGATASYFGTHTTHRLRQQEIDNAYTMVVNSPWAQKNNIFLMGHSEGGIAAARTKRDDFQGIIISGWTCHSKYQGYAGIYSPLTVPVLSIIWKQDRWFPQGRHDHGTCESSLVGRARSKHVTLEGFDHNTFYSTLAREEVKKFLLENLK
jgi:dienelactone hydrolase